MLKRWVVAHPEIREDKLNKRTACLIIASDGLWDALTDQEAIDEVMKHTDPEAAARAVITVAYDRGSYDNISAIVAYVDFSGLDEEDGGGRGRRDVQCQRQAAPANARHDDDDESSEHWIFLLLVT